MSVSSSGTIFNPSISHANKFIAILRNYFGAREGLTVIVGRGATPPAVFSDFSATDYGTFGNGQLGFVNELQVAESAGSTTYTFTDHVTSGGAVGDLAWIAFFELASPSGSDPVLSVAGPFIVSV